MQEPTRIIAIRHGETAWNAGQRMQGHLDIPLNEQGLWQATQLPAALADEAIAAVYSSDLARARVTAEAFALPLQLPLTLSAGLRERCFGEFEGCTYDEITERWPDGALRWRSRDVAFAPAGGESLVAFSARCVGEVARLAAGHAGQTIAVVAHGGVLDCLYRAATGLALDAPRTWLLGNATVNRLMRHDQGWALVGWNDDRHLARPSADETLTA